MRTAIKTMLAIALVLFFAVTMPACQTTHTDNLEVALDIGTRCAYNETQQ